MSEVRRRKVGAQNGVNEEQKKSGNDNSSKSIEGNHSWLLLVVEVAIALSIALSVGYKYALYVKELHENDMWFSNIGVSGNYGVFSSLLKLSFRPLTNLDI